MNMPQLLKLKINPVLKIAQTYIVKEASTTAESLLPLTTTLN